LTLDDDTSDGLLSLRLLIVITCLWLHCKNIHRCTLFVLCSSVETTEKRYGSYFKD